HRPCSASCAPYTTLLRSNWAFQYEGDEQGFVEYLLTDQPEPPRYFATMKHLNKVNRPLLIEVPKHPKLSREAFLSAYNKGIKVRSEEHTSELQSRFDLGC